MTELFQTISGKASGKTIAALVVFILFLLFLLQNSATVDIRFLFWKVSMSRILLLLGSLVVGCLIGVLVGWEIFGKKQKKTKEEHIAYSDEV